MRITFVCPTLNMSGGYRVVAIYADLLSRMGHDVFVVSAAAPIPPFRQKLKSWLRGSGWASQKVPHRSYFDNYDNSSVRHHVARELRPIGDGDVPDSDVVIATWWETAEWVHALSPSKGAKVYFIQHHEIFPNLPRVRCEATYRLPLHKVVVANWLKDVMAAQYGDYVVDIVPNSVERTQFFSEIRSKQAVPTVGLLYSTHTIKGLDIALAAIQIVRKHIPNLHLLSFGSEPLRSNFMLPESAEFLFCPPQDKIRYLYSHCDVWLTASRTEGFNLPAMEAMACRTPVVASKTGWPQEAVKSKWNGILVDLEDIPAFARGVEWVLSLDNEQWNYLSANAYSTVASESWHKSAKVFENALHNACLRSKRGEIAGHCTSENGSGALADAKR